MSMERDNLDALLKQARWPDASQDSTRRLEEFWKDQWSARPLRAKWLWPAAAAATIAIGIGSLIVLLLNPPRMLPQIGSISVNPGRNLVVGPPPRVSVVQSRPPTMRELLIIGDMRPGTKNATIIAPPTAQIPPRDTQTLVGLINSEQNLTHQRELIAELLRSDDAVAVGLYLQLVADGARREVALDALAEVKDPPVQELIDQLRNPRVAIRFAAARALGRIDGPITTEQLVVLVRRNTQRREALAALLCSDGPDASAFVASAQNQPALAGTLRSVQMQLKTVQ